MIITNSKIVRTYKKAGYVIKVEDWSHGEGWEPTKMRVAYTLADDYIGDTKFAYRLCTKRGIAPEKINPDDCVCSIGFCEKENKWYGWSHRAIYGFGIGSEVKKGDCAYVPANRQEYINDLISWYTDESHKNLLVIEERNGIRVKYDVVSNSGDSFRHNSLEVLDIKYGRGEWTAKTLDDAKQMAIDFAYEVS